MSKGVSIEVLSWEPTPLRSSPSKISMFILLGYIVYPPCSSKDLKQSKKHDIQPSGGLKPPSFRGVAGISKETTTWLIPPESSVNILIFLWLLLRYVVYFLCSSQELNIEMKDVTSYSPKALCHHLTGGSKILNGKITYSNELGDLQQNYWQVYWHSLWALFGYITCTLLQLTKVLLRRWKAQPFEGSEPHWGVAKINKDSWNSPKGGQQSWIWLKEPSTLEDILKERQQHQQWALPCLTAQMSNWSWKPTNSAKLEKHGSIANNIEVSTSDIVVNIFSQFSHECRIIFLKKGPRISLKK